MGIFDIFRRKKSANTFPENELEQKLKLYDSDVQARKEFYQKLLWNELYILTDSHSESKVKNQSREESNSVNFIAFDNGFIPIFTSENRIFDNAVIKDEIPFFRLNGQELFEVTKGMNFVLNPYSDVSKEITKNEIDYLLDGTIDKFIDESETEKLRIQEFNKIFERAGKSQEGLLHLDGYNRKDLIGNERKRLEESIVDYKKCLNIEPNHWPSMMLMAKSLQRLERHLEALDILELAFKIELENHTIPMEASLEAMHLQDIDKAIYYSEESLKRKPNDYILMGNHAMNLLVAGKDDDALKFITEAINLNPNDSINRKINRTISDVVSGLKNRPTFDDAIK